MDRRRTPPLHYWRAAARELIDEITTAAECIGAARTATGESIFATDARSRLLRAIERSPYCLSIADAARALRVSRQAAHRIAHAAAVRGDVELLTNHDDERILQILLTAQGRTSLRAAVADEATWLAALLNGLGDHEMAATTHVIRVIRQRLERDARDLARRK